MTYSEFLNTLSYAFNLFIDTITKWANNLITNYFFITILGVTIFISFVLFVSEELFIHNIKKHSECDNLYN